VTDRINIAMWSGPRNLSTALMRSFGNRKDVLEVFDEPFYAAYLKTTNKQHPMFQEVLDSQEQNYNLVVKNCISQEGTGICYQKHMVHHLLPSFDLDWVLLSKNCFLIRKPEDVISSFLNKWPIATFEDFGFKEQLNLYNFIKKKSEKEPIVVDANDLRKDPKKTLKKLCESLRIKWDSSMLSWTPGLKSYDGVWAKHWYPSVMSSDSFKPLSNTKKTYNQNIMNYAHMAQDYYEELYQYKI